MLAFENEAAVDLVRQDHDVTVANDVSNCPDVLLTKHPAGRVLRRVNDDELGSVADQRREFIDIQPEIAVFPQAGCGEVAQRGCR